MSNFFITEVTVEIPKGTSNKYEHNPNNQRLYLDRVLYGANFYPGEYGYIENTLDLDGDPLDVICLSTYPTIPGCIIRAKILGAMNMIDDGEIDTKLIGVMADDPRFDHINEFNSVPPHFLKEVEDFFQNYKNLQKKQVTISGFEDVQKAQKELSECQERFQKYKTQIHQLKKADLVALINKS